MGDGESLPNIGEAGARQHIIHIIQCSRVSRHSIKPAVGSRKRVYNLYNEALVRRVVVVVNHTAQLMQI